MYLLVPTESLRKPELAESCSVLWIIIIFPLRDTKIINLFVRYSLDDDFKQGKHFWQKNVFSKLKFIRFFKPLSVTWLPAIPSTSAVGLCRTGNHGAPPPLSLSFSLLPSVLRAIPRPSPFPMSSIPHFQPTGRLLTSFASCKTLTCHTLHCSKIRLTGH